MAAPAAVIVPTAGRPGYLDVALGSLAPQAAAAGAELIVVDDGPSDATRATAERHGARYIAHDRGRGLNAARNTAVAATGAPLLCFVDDDVRAKPGWLDALLRGAAEAGDDVLVFTGPIRAVFEGVRRRTCGRELPPVTHLDLGSADTDAEYAWGANLTLRREAIVRAGPFDETLGLYGDEQEWQDRVRAAGGHVRYLAGAALEHRRAGADATPAALRRAARARGRASRRYDVLRGRAPSLTSELRVLAGCIWHGPRRRCANGPVMAAHSLGRVSEALGERFSSTLPPARAGIDDFLSGRSGIVAGRAALLLGLQDALLDLAALPTRPRRARAAAALAPRRVLALAIARTDTPNILDPALAELRRSRHEVTIARADARPGVGKFAALNQLIAAHDLADFDRLLVIDDDVALPRRFLDVFLAAAESGNLALAQPAHRRRSHAAWPVTRRASGCDWRETTFCEIGPVTAFAPATFATLLPFPSEPAMGWGLDVHWSALAREHGWRVGVVDATPISHLLRPTAGGYPREQAAAQARAFLAGRPYVRRDEVRTLARRRFGAP